MADTHLAALVCAMPTPRRSDQLQQALILIGTAKDIVADVVTGERARNPAAALDLARVVEQLDQLEGVLEVSPVFAADAAERISARP